MHFAHHPLGGFDGHAFKNNIASGERGIGVERQQQAVVVQHFFEVRNHPVLIHRVAAKTTTKLIVDPARRHGVQREARHVQGVAVIGMRRPVAQQALDGGRMRKLRRLAEAAVFRFELLGDFLACPGQHAVVDLRARRRAAVRQTPEVLAHGGILLGDCNAVLAVVGSDALAQIGKGGKSKTRRLRKIGATEERRVIIGCEKHGERPAAGALRKHLMRHLVDAVEVGAFFAVDLDIDEQLVHHLCGGFILE